MEKELLQYGIAGIGLIALAWYILKKDSSHKKERQELIEKDEKHFDRLNQITDETNRVLRENTNILSGLKTLLENRNK